MPDPVIPNGSKLKLISDIDTRIERLTKRLERERKARAEAETIAEEGFRQLYRKQQEIELLQAVAVSSNEAASFTEALQSALQHICARIGCSAGQAYLTAPGAPRELIPAGLWYQDSPDLRSPTASGMGMPQFPGREAGLPERVLAEEKPIWISDAAIDRRSPGPVVRTGKANAARIPFPEVA